MPRALVLYPNGTLKHTTLPRGGAAEEISGFVDGISQMLPRTLDGAPCVAYANEDGSVRDMDYNSWGFVIASLGFYVDFSYGVRGPVVLVGPITKTGDHGALPSKYIAYVERVKELEDADKSMAMEELVEYFKAHQKMPPQKRRRPKDSTSGENEKEDASPPPPKKAKVVPAQPEKKSA